MQKCSDTHTTPVIKVLHLVDFRNSIENEKVFESSYSRNNEKKGGGGSEKYPCIFNKYLCASKIDACISKLYFYSFYFNFFCILTSRKEITHN